MPRLYEDEPLWRTGLRNISRPINQGLATALGWPGDAEQMLLNLTKHFADPEDKLNKAWAKD